MVKAPTHPNLWQKKYVLNYKHDKMKTKHLYRSLGELLIYFILWIVIIGSFLNITF